MKKLCYVITLLCFMFFGVSNVFAAGNVDVPTPSLEIAEGGTATFNIVVSNAIARAEIVSKDTNVATVSSTYFIPGSSTSWLSDQGLVGKSADHPVVVTATGKAGTTTTIEIDVYDASTYDGETLSPLKFTVSIKIVDASSGSGNVQPPVTGNTYKVTYDANGGINAPADQTKNENTTLTLSTTKPTKDKYEFVGWNTKKDGTGDNYSAGGAYTANANVTLYAQWKEVSNVTTNPNTGDSTIFIVLAIVITFGGYSYWYNKKAKEN